MKSSYHFQIGSFECIVINDGDFVGNAEMLFTNAPKEELLAALQDHDLQPDHLPSTWTCLLVKTPANVVLVDTGFGAGGEYGGKLLSVLQAAGYRPQDIDTVVLTHAHADHIGGCVDDAGKPAFPEATYYIGHDEWKFWTAASGQPNVSGWAADFARQKLMSIAAQLKTVSAETEIVPGIRAIAAPGHTAGHMAVEVTSGGETLLNLADAVLHPIQITHPEWIARVDQFPEQTAMTRRAFYQRAIDKDPLVLAYHFSPFPSLGKISGQSEKWRWQPLSI